MTKLALAAYHFLKNRKAAFYAVLLLPMLLFVYLASKIEFEEDITKLLPSAEDGSAKELVFSNLKVKDKVFILFNPKSDSVTVEDLTVACDEFVEALLAKDTVNNTINNVLYQLDEELFMDGISFLYENVPTFLNDDQLRQLDGLLEKGSVEKQMGENYADLRSAAGSTLLSIITHDPIGIRNLFLSNSTGSIGGGIGGGNFTMYENHIFTADTTIAVAFLSPNFGAFNSKQGIHLTNLIESEVQAFKELHPEVEILCHGAPMQGVYNSRQIKKDLSLTISISLLLIFTILIVCFKNKSTLVYLVIPVIYGVLFSLAVMFLIKGSMSLMALGIGAIVMGVAFSYCMHVITHYKYVSDPVIIIKDQTVPVILGALTTIGAFMGLMLTKSELLKDFGLFASLGLVGTTVFSLVFLPQFFNPNKNKKSEKAFHILEKINSFPLEKQKWLIALILIVSAVCYVMSDKVKFDSNLQNIGYHDEGFMRSRNLLESKTSNAYATIYFASISSDLDSALVYNRLLCRRLGELADSGQIFGYSNPASLFIPSEQQQERIDRWREYWTEDRVQDIKSKVDDAASKYKFAPTTFAPFFGMLEAEYEPVSLYEAGILPPEILDNIIEFTDNKYLVFTPVQMQRNRLLDVGDQIVVGHPEFVVIDPMYYTSDMVKVVHGDFSVTLTISSLFVLVVLLLSYKSIVLALLAFLPMGLSWYIVLGTMAIFGIDFNLINIIISTFIFGIGVDYSIFIMDGLLSTYRGRGVLLTYHKTAIFFSAVILIIVIVSLLFAVHPAISSIGTSTLIGMGATILIAYSLQPFLFSLMVSNRTKKGKAPITINGLLSLGKTLTPAQTLRNNYAYKGFNVTRKLNSDLLKTHSYSLVASHVTDAKSLLDLGCGYGFTSYRASAANNRLSITGFDTDEAAVMLANSCYQKTDLMQFSTQESVLNSKYDVVILNSTFALKEILAQQVVAFANTVIVRKSLCPIYDSLLQEEGFNSKESDSIYTVYIK